MASLMKEPLATHERLVRDEEIQGSSNRSFGLLFAVVFAVVGLWPLIHGDAPRLWPLGLALAFLVVASLRPALLSPLNRLWTRFGLLLHRVVNPIIMALLFFSTVTPTGLVMRLLGKDPLRLRFQPEAKSYWIARQPPGPPPEGMKNQF